MKKVLFCMCISAMFITACDDSDSSSVCGNGILEKGEECDGNAGLENLTCSDLKTGSTGSLGCTKTCTIDISKCTTCNHNGIKDADEECDGEDFGGATCATIDPNKPFGQLGCSNHCKISTTFCAASDLGLQAPYRDSEQTDALCSDGLNNFNTVDQQGNPATWIDCKSHSCLTSPIVQVCQSLENNDTSCSDGIDNPTASGMPKDMSNVKNDLIDCKDPSCFKNWRVTVCQSEAPKWEFGDECTDGIDNDGDTLVDCDDPDCLHAGSPCDLNGRARVLFDNAHHQIAGAVDWIVDITGRHPFPSKPAKEDDWHGSLSSWGKDLLDSGHFIVETLPQDRTFTYKDSTKPQDLTNYNIVVSVEPSVKYTPDEIKALYEFVKDGGSLMLFADHTGADRDGNDVDAVKAINDLLAQLPNAKSLTENPWGFSVKIITEMKDETAAPNANAIAEIVKDVKKTGSYAGTAFDIHNHDIAKSILVTDNSKLDYAIAIEYEKGRIIAIGDSSITGDGTNFLGIKLKNAGYKELDNKAFLINAMEWLRHSKK